MFDCYNCVFCLLEISCLVPLEGRILPRVEDSDEAESSNSSSSHASDEDIAASETHEDICDTLSLQYAKGVGRNANMFSLPPDYSSCTN